LIPEQSVLTVPLSFTILKSNRCALGIYIDNMLTSWQVHVDKLYSKLQQRLYGFNIKKS